MAADTTPPVIARIRIMARREIIRPATASPLGFLKMPTREKIRPRSHTIQPNIGIHPSRRESRARMKPAIPIPLLLEGCGWL